MEPHELHQAITSFGYNLSPQALGTLVRRYSTDGKIGFDDFVSCCIRLRTLTGKGRGVVGDSLVRGCGHLYSRICIPVNVSG